MFGRFTHDDRMLPAFASAEAADQQHARIGNDHLILGMLCNARSPLFDVLGEQGLHLAGARDAVRAHHEEHDTDADPAAGPGPDDRYDEDREALRSIGIDLDKVRAAVRDRFGDDLADGWADRRERGRGRNCGPRGRRGHHGHGRPRGHGAGGPEGCGPGPFGNDRFGNDRFGGDRFGAEQFDHGPFEPGRGRRGPRGRGMRPRFAPETRQALEVAVGIARERHDDHLRAEYLLLGILDTADPASVAVINSATTVDDVRAAVLASLPEAPAGV